MFLIHGISFYFSNDKKFDDFNKKFGYTLTEDGCLDGYSIYRGFYEGYKDFRYIDGKKINVQIAFVEETWIVGFPLILTGF